MSISMCSKNISFFGNSDISMRTRRQARQIARAMGAAWPSAEAMSYDLDDLGGISVTPRTCQNWRNGSTEPSASRWTVIKQIIIKQSEQQIQAKLAVIEALKQ